MMAKRLGYVASGLAIAASAVYLFVYLYRWEWNRALIAGVILVIAELALIGSLVLDKLRSLEQRLEDLEEDGAAPSPLRQIKENAPAPRSRFQWLADDGDLKVFVPVLMGAGVLFSGIAWLVERLARTTARPALEYGLAARLGVLALPQGGFLTPITRTGPVETTTARRYRTAFVLLAVVAAITFTIDALGDLTQNRPDERLTTGTGVVTLEIERRGFARSDMAAARSLWGTCSGTVSGAHRATGFERLESGAILMIIEPAIGPNAQKRLRGCLSDATIDNLRARVVGITTAR